LVTLGAVDADISGHFGGLAPGHALGPLATTISEAANDRYWEGAGVDHPLRRAGALYPLIAANLTVLTFQQHCPAAMIQTRQQLRCHVRRDAPATLVTTGFVTACWERRELPYISVHTEVRCDGESLWTSSVHFTPAALVGARR
jgi:hypothetical protein